MENDNAPALVPELSCSDFAASLAFYRDVLGFHMVFERPEAQFGCIALGNARIMLKQINAFWATGEMLRPYGRGINLQISVNNAKLLSEQITLRDITLFSPLETSWYRMDSVERGVAEFLVQDPDGYLLRFSQHIADRPADRTHA